MKAHAQILKENQVKDHTAVCLFVYVSCPTRDDKQNKFKIREYSSSMFLNKPFLVYPFSLIMLGITLTALKNELSAITSLRQKSQDLLQGSRQPKIGHVNTDSQILLLFIFNLHCSRPDKATIFFLGIMSTVAA